MRFLRYRVAILNRLSVEMAVSRWHGGYGNQEGMTAPFTSEWGQELAVNTPALVAHPLPIGRNRHSYKASVGGFVSLAASLKPVVAGTGYFGDLPQSQQDTVSAPPAWERP